ncbi:aspartyl/asparaginyl beta-hydroxylase domain-containing protein [Gloeobacter violaceus]|uniref:Glr1100 protein n=1 Tax=Gloeobacter violaceus (strain ATCC 29082 / PCC 7421) TaxID=251221 RepID=Q7NLM2_GLOVI|nr:aspartyl/asparaginyl beta-hydroxylase domain-containing protein [Gloeobacter violaceus]BAC89041.1 glr1100 [Gloeobacter violaceus PCC 7421]
MDKRALRLDKSLGRLQGNLINRFSCDADTRFFEPNQFPWVADLESNWKIIRRDLDEALLEQEQIPYFSDLSQRQSRFSGTAWKSVMFYVYGRRVDENCRRFVQTAALLQRVPGLNLAMFSILGGHAHIPPHLGPCKGVLRYHLGLIIPVEDERCAIRVDNEVRSWKEGKSLLFDDTFEHEVWNRDPRCRAVLMLDFLRPLPPWLSAINRGIIAAAGQFKAVKDFQGNANRYARGKVQ